MIALALLTIACDRLLCWVFYLISSSPGKRERSWIGSSPLSRAGHMSDSSSRVLFFSLYYYYTITNLSIISYYGTESRTAQRRQPTTYVAYHTTYLIWLIWRRILSTMTSHDSPLLLTYIFTTLYSIHYYTLYSTILYTLLYNILNFLLQLLLLLLLLASILLLLLLL